MALGTIYVELDLDVSKFEKAQKTIINRSKEAATLIETNWRVLGNKSDVMYQAMANQAILAYDKITKQSKVSAEEQFRAQSAMVHQINSLNQQMAKNPLYETLGIRSTAAIKAQMDAVISSYNTIKNQAGVNAQDLIKIERAKNAKLNELSKEMVGQHEMSLAAMTRAVLRLYAAYFVLRQVFDSVIEGWKKGFKAVETYNTSVASLAAMVVTFSEKQKGMSLEDQWRGALKYSSAMIPILEQIAAKTLLSGEETTALANAFARSGVFLDANNKAQMEAFTRISNALPLMTRGQEIMRQINTEIRSMMTGQNAASSMLLQTLKAQDPLIAQNLDLWRRQGTVMENIGEMLKGFGPATEILENQWQAVKTTLDTTVTQTLRGGMKPVYEELIKLAKDFNKLLLDNQKEIGKGFEMLGNQLAFAKDSIKTAKLLFDLLLIGSPWKKEKEWEVGVHTQTRPPAPGIVPPSAEEIEAAKKLNEKLLKEAEESMDEEYKLKKKQQDSIDKIIREQYLDERKLYEKNQKDLEHSWEIYAKNLDEERDKLTDRIRERIMEERKLYENSQKELERSWEIYAKNLDEERDKTTDQIRENIMKQIKDQEDYEKSQVDVERTIQEWKLKGVEADQKADDEKYRATEQYRKIMLSEEDFSVNRHKQAMNRILTLEEEKYRKIEELGRKAGKTDFQIEKDKLEIMKNYSRQKQQIVRDELMYGLSDMETAFNNISQMYDKNSDQYARMQEAARLMIVLQNAVAVANAVAAISAAAAAPFPAGFVAMASMAAAMTSLLGSAGIAFGGGGGNYSVPSLPPSTVLGAVSGTGSESIPNVYKLLEDTYTLQYRELTGIHSSMVDLNTNITGLVRGIVRSGIGGGSFGEFGTPLNIGQQASQFIMSIPILGNIMKAFNSLTGGIFGSIGQRLDEGLFGSSTTSLDRTGVLITNSGKTNILFGDLINKEQLLVQGFADMRKETEGAFFGLFGGGGTSTWTEYRALDQSISTMMSNVFKNLGNTMLEINKSLGSFANISSILGYSFNLGKIDLTGLSGEDINKKISETISNISDKMVEDLFGSIIGSYQQLNEGLMETAMRIIVNKEIVLDALDMTGQAFAGTTAELIEFSESVISISGSLDKFRAATEDYFNAFFNDVEKQARLQDQLVKAMGTVNLLLPATRDGYRDLVESLDLKTQSDKEAYITMMQLSKSADEYYSALEAIADKQDELTESLRKQIDTISNWIAEMNRSNLAPAQSLQVWGAEYIKQRQKAMGAGATESDVSNYLNYAKDYLGNMKSMGDNYKDIFTMVMRDVTGLQAGAEDTLAQRQLDAAKALSDAAGDLSRAGKFLQLANMVGAESFNLGSAPSWMLDNLLAAAQWGSLPSLYRPGQKLPGLEVIPSTAEGYASAISEPAGLPVEELIKMPIGSLKSLYNRLRANRDAITGPQSVGDGNMTLDITIPVVIDGVEIDRLTAKVVVSGGQLQEAIDKRIKMVA